MGSTLAIVLIGVFLGVVQLAAGMVIGRCWPPGPRKQKPSAASLPSQPAETPEPVDAGELQMFACRLHELVSGVAHEVGHHQSTIHRINQELHSLEGNPAAPLTEIILRSVARVIEINERLRDRLSQAEKKLHHQSQQIQSHMTEARTDPLTGLPNRRAFDDQLARQVAHWRNGELPFCLLMIDLDHFKAINDRYGHPVGDQLLRIVAKAIRATVRTMDHAARIGGEEFAAILPVTRLETARRIAERIRRKLADRAVEVDGLELELSVSIGLAEILLDENAASIIQRADTALYASKHAGRNSVHYHDGERCLPSSQDSGASERLAAQGPAPESESPPPLAADLAAVCDDLRRRLVEVTEGENQN